MKLDYLDSKTILSEDGRRHDLKRLSGFGGGLLVRLGEIGALKGRAYKDYLEEVNRYDKGAEATTEGGGAPKTS